MSSIFDCIPRPIIQLAKADEPWKMEGRRWRNRGARALSLHLPAHNADTYPLPTTRSRHRIKFATCDRAVTKAHIH
ncbi:hypothetical protein SK128_022205 [Halocaridina rubra]|uniref:Uncharacterized protein n=1 Tax=Halocaridina rubra TaxID=373956 RepID=A0AAN9A2Z1_HALRR